MPCSFRYTNIAVLLKVRLTPYGLKSLRFKSAKIRNISTSHLDIELLLTNPNQTY